MLALYCVMEVRMTFSTELNSLSEVSLFSTEDKASFNEASASFRLFNSSGVYMSSLSSISDFSCAMIDLNAAKRFSSCE